MRHDETGSSGGTTDLVVEVLAVLEAGAEVLAALVAEAKLEVKLSLL